MDTTFDLPPIQWLTSETKSLFSKTEKVKKWVANLFRAHESLLLAIMLSGNIRTLWSLGRQTRELVARLNSPLIDTIPSGEVRRLAHELSQLAIKQRKLVEVYEEMNLRSNFAYRGGLSLIDDSSIHLQSVVEGLHLSSSEDFKKMIVDAASEITSDTVGMERSALVGQV